MEYWRLKQAFPQAAKRKRVVANLATLRAQLDEEVPPKNVNSDLLLATWNIRDLGKVNRRGFGERQPETYFYIAETLSRFDFVAVQEVNELDEWQKVIDVLGPDWDWIATDVTDPSIGGNGERLTFLWDRRKVHFRHIAGELVLPAELTITKHVKPKDGPKDVVQVKGEQVGQQFRRTPFAALFQAAWFKFEICTVHIYYGSESGAELKERVEEIQRVGEFFGKRAKAAFKRRPLVDPARGFQHRRPQTRDDGRVARKPASKLPRRWKKRPPPTSARTSTTTRSSSRPALGTSPTSRRKGAEPTLVPARSTSSSSSTAPIDSASTKRRSRTVPTRPKKTTSRTTTSSGAPTSTPTTPRSGCG